MNLFKSVEKHLDSVNVSIVITKNGDKLSVSFLPQLKSEDKSKEEIVPLMLKGTAEELDAEFVTIISSPLQKVSGIASNLIQYEAKIKKMEESTKIAEEAKKLQVEDDKKATKKMESAQKWLDKKDWKKASKFVKEALELAPKLESAVTAAQLIKFEDPSLDLKVSDVPVSTEKVKTEEFSHEKIELVGKAKELVDGVSKEPTSMKEVAPEKQQEAEVEDPEFTEFDNIEDLPENLVTELPKVVKSKEELDIECNSFVDQALPLASEKKYEEAKVLLEKGLAIQPKHQRALGALNKVEGWIAEIENAQIAAGEMASEVGVKQATAAVEKVVQVVEEEVSLVGVDRPKRKDMEPMADFVAREEAWEEVNSPFIEEEKSESQQKEDDFNAEKPDVNRNPSTNASPIQEEEEDDEF